MNYSAMIQNRKSVRAFTDKKVPYSVAQEIETYYQTSVKRLIPQLETELYIFRDDVKSALEGAAGYNQFLVGAPQYLVLLSEKDDLAQINAGFIMEDLVLNLTDMDLDTCWVTFTDSEQIKASLGIESSKDVVAIVAFGINSGAYVAENIRAGILSVDIGQTEAGLSLGLSRGTTMLKIVIPQAIKNVIPAIGNELIALIKETSIVSMIGMKDLNMAAQVIGGGNNLATYFAPMLVAAMFYLAIVYTLTFAIKRIEKRLRASDKR
jgi:ABC-type amino acid transport system permease subunit